MMPCSTPSANGAAAGLRNESNVIYFDNDIPNRRHGMNAPDTFVSIDLETTGLDPRLCEIIEIGAVKYRDGKIVGEFSEFVKPDAPVPPFITHLTGITESDVRGAAPIGDVLPRFQDFIRDFRLLGQNVKFDISFLRSAAGMGAFETAIDNIELARILIPRLPSYSLDSLIDFFAVDPGKRHRALDDARVTAEIFLKLVGMLRLVPLDFVAELARISQRTGSVLQDVFEAQLTERVNEPVAAVKPPKTPEAWDNIYGDFTRELPPRDEQAAPHIDPEEAASILANGGALSRIFDSYEERSGQIAMTRKVAQAFNDSEIIMAEAGTGTGKSIAYLLPSIHWAETARERVIVSTNTKNLQEQLFFNDIPLLGRVLDFPFRAVILKGRGNYICLHRWQRVVDMSNRFLGRTERDLVLPVAAWLNQTTTGDLSETGFFSMLIESGLYERINSEPISCAGGRCKHRERCFVNRIRKAAQRAHIIIVNHSLVFSDMVSDGGVLGPYSRIVFDEAHNIEKVALRYLGASLGYYRIRRVLNHLFAMDGQHYGVLAMLKEWAGKMAKAWPEFGGHTGTIDLVIDGVRQALESAGSLFSALDITVRAAAASDHDTHEGKLRYFSQSPVFDAVAEKIELFLDGMNQLLAGIQDIALIVSGVSSSHLDDREEVAIELEKNAADLQAVVDDLQFLREAGGRNVFWFEYPSEGSRMSIKINSAPLNVAENLAVNLYDHMETVVMTSATMTVARDFSYISGRLGLNLDRRERLVAFIASSPFDYQSQAAIIAPRFLPSPKSEDFIDQTNRVIGDLARELRRGMLVLFTSKGHLQRAYYDLRNEFLQSGITLLGQDIDGSRRLILRRFREETTSVLFGTDSFWEGVDVPGSALELLVIARLPFAVPTDPVIQAQMEEIARAGGNPFMEFSVPEAAIKLRQGAGRLIRHRGDYGAVIVLDNRIVTTRYGGIFARSLPGKPLRADNIDMLVENLRGWFESRTPKD